MVYLYFNKTCRDDGLLNFGEYSTRERPKQILPDALMKLDSLVDPVLRVQADAKIAKPVWKKALSGVLANNVHRNVCTSKPLDEVLRFGVSQVFRVARSPSLNFQFVINDLKFLYHTYICIIQSYVPYNHMYHTSICIIHTYVSYIHMYHTDIHTCVSVAIVAQVRNTLLGL